MSMDDDEDFQAFIAHLEQLEAEHGIERNDYLRQGVLEKSMENGFNPEATERAFAETHRIDIAEPEPEIDDVLANDDVRELLGHVKSDLDRLEKDLGRRLLDSEKEAIAHRTLEYVNRHDEFPEGIMAGFLNEHHNGNLPTRREVVHARLREAEQAEQPDEQEFDMDTHQGRVGYMKARLAGFEEVAGDDAEPDHDELDPDSLEGMQARARQRISEYEEAA